MAPQFGIEIFFFFARIIYSFVFQQIFRPSTKDYDVVIELHQRNVPKHIFVDPSSRQSSSSVKLCSSVRNDVTNTIIPVVDFDPANCYMKELEVLTKTRIFQKRLKIIEDRCKGFNCEGSLIL